MIKKHLKSFHLKSFHKLTASFTSNYFHPGKKRMKNSNGQLVTRHGASFTTIFGKEESGPTAPFYITNNYFKPAFDSFVMDSSGEVAATATAKRGTDGTSSECSTNGIIVGTTDTVIADGDTGGITSKYSTSGTFDGTTVSVTTDEGTDGTTASVTTDGGTDGTMVSVTTIGGTDGTTASVTSNGGTDEATASVTTDGGTDRTTASISDYWWRY